MEQNFSFDRKTHKTFNEFTPPPQFVNEQDFTIYRNILHVFHHLASTTHARLKNKFFNPDTSGL